MNCKEARDRMTAHDGSPSGAGHGVARHLESCAACSGYAARLRVARELFRDHHAGVEPDAGFSSRVVAALPRTAGPIGWAALRLLPAAIALVIVLGGWCYIDAHRPADLLERAQTPSETVVSDEAPSDDPLSWALTSNGGSS